MRGSKPGRFRVGVGLAVVLFACSAAGIFRSWSPVIYSSGVAHAQLGRVAHPQDFFYRVARGLVPGVAPFEKFGENPNLSLNTTATIWDAGGIYVPPTTERVHDIASTDAADAGTVRSSGTATGGSLTTLEDSGATFVSDGVAANDIILNDTTMQIARVTSVTEISVTFAVGWSDASTGESGPATAVSDAYRVVTEASTGASIIHILGTDLGRNFQEEFVVTNGLTDVETGFNYARIFRMRAFAGSGSGVIGIVTATAQTDATVTAQIIDGNNQTKMAIYTLPIDKVGYLIYFTARLSKRQAATVEIDFLAGQLDGLSYPVLDVTVSSTGNSDVNYPFPVPRRVSPGTDLWVEGLSSANSTGVSVGFCLLLVDV